MFSIDFLASTTPERRAQLASQAQQALRSARTLWKISKQVLKPHEAMLRYQLWMCMAEVLQGALDDLVAGRKLPSLDDALKTLRATSTAMQATMRSSYQFSVDDQERQLRELWPFLAAGDHAGATP